MRYGCPDCGHVFADLANGEAYAACENMSVPLVPLPLAADLLAFKLRASGRHDEATDVEDLAALAQEGHGPR